MTFRYQINWSPKKLCIAKNCKHQPQLLTMCVPWTLFLYQQTLTEMSGSMSRVKVCCWRFFRVSFILLSLKFLLVNLSKSLSLSVEGCSGQKRVVLPPWPPWRRRPWLFKSPRIDTRNWWWVAICRKKSLLLTCTRDSQGFSATLPSSNFWWRRCSRNESSKEKQSQTYYCM